MLTRKILQDSIPYALGETNFDFLGKKYNGKVRDVYEVSHDSLVFITTDRQSAFDRQLALVPFKGQVLTGVSNYWFEELKSIVPSHVLSIPHPNVTIVKKLRMFPVEFVVRGYLTGVTKTSIWTAYTNGKRKFFGITLPEGMRKNQALPKPLLTPTTKSDLGDEQISLQEIVATGLMSQAELDECVAIVLKLFAHGTKKSAQRGLILVDTKYELGKDTHGVITLGDEVHTPDSSRYWLANNFAEHFAKDEEPEYIDKEFLRLWFKDNSNPYEDKQLPKAPPELIAELAWRYILLYQKITGKDFILPEAKNVFQSLEQSLKLRESPN